MDIQALILYEQTYRSYQMSQFHGRPLNPYQMSQFHGRPLNPLACKNISLR